MDWLPAWEQTLASIAAALIAVGVVWRYLIAPGFRLVRAFFRRAKKLTAEVEEVRRLVAENHSIVAQELTANGGGSAVDKLNRMKSDIVELKSDTSDLKAGQHELATMWAESMALGERKTDHYLRQLRDKGIDLEQLPDVKDRRKRPAD